MNKDWNLTLPVCNEFPCNLLQNFKNLQCKYVSLEKPATISARFLTTQKSKNFSQEDK